MENLPVEILHRVFIQLDLQQRLICLLVCRSWWHVLNGYSLFYSVELTKGKEQLYKFMNKFKLLPDRAAQAEVLHIIIKNNTHFNRRELLNIFPNARVMKVESDWTTSSFESSQFTTHIDMTHSKSKVEFLSDFHHCELACQMLNSNVGGRLKTLYLDFCQIPNNIDVISQLKDLPILKKLTLRSPKFKLVDLENLHKNVPSIQDFALDSVTITSGSMPSEIIPATSITKLQFYYGSLKNVEAHTQFYKYMAKKYTNVYNVDCEDRRLLKYDINERKQIYSNGILDFFKTIGPSQNKLAICGLPDGVDVFKALDAVGSQIKDISFIECNGGTLLEYLSQSHQSSYIEKIVTLNTSIDSIHLIKNMSALTTFVMLYIYLDDMPFYLTDCLAACPPSVKSFIIHGNNIVVDPLKVKLDSIETLEIGYDGLTSNLGDIISTCLPNLVNLKLTGDVKENVNITLQNPHFQKATIRTFAVTVYEVSKHGFSFKSPNQTKTQYYLCRNGRKKHVQWEDIQDLPLLSVVSLTNKKLEVSNCFTILPC